jgi:hypothetical protein
MMDNWFVRIGGGFFQVAKGSQAGLRTCASNQPCMMMKDNACCLPLLHSIQPDVKKNEYIRTISPFHYPSYLLP